MKGGLLGNIFLVLISVVLLATIIGLFFGVNLLDYVMTHVARGLAVVFDFFAGLINAIV
jgi:hypothetical protein